MTRVIEPKHLEARRKQRTKKHAKKHRRYILTSIIFTLIGVYSVAVLVVPLPLLQAETGDIKLQTGTTVSMPWPKVGQAAVGAVGYGLLDHNGEEQPLPIASVAKVITAIAVLKVKPLNIGETGDKIQITESDVQTYLKYEAEGQSYIEVEAGEELTEYQALQALMLPSASNIADVLVVWAFGSIDNYLAFVNPFTKSIGMQNTTIADASGFSPNTVSTAVDLTKLAEIAMNNPVLSEIVSQAEADLPVAGRVFNVNNLLGKNDIVGIKTGLTQEAGGCYMFAATRKLDNENTITVFGVVLGATSRDKAMADSLPLIDEAFSGFKNTTVIKTDQVVGNIYQTNGEKVPIVVRQGLSVLVWSNQKLTYQSEFEYLGRQITTDDKVGKLVIKVGELSYDVQLRSSKTIKNRSLMWRLRNGGGYI